MPSPSGERAEDPRTARTKDRVSWSLVELIQEKGYDATTVSDVAARAEVSRSTFYAHFEDKDEVFLQHFTGFMTSLGESLRVTREDPETPAVQNFFKHVQSMRPLYVELQKARRLDYMFKFGQVVLSQTIEARLNNRPALPDALPAAIVAQHLAATLFTLLTWWMDHHQPVEPEELERTFYRLTQIG
jgi:AcrR family transcriptional regulator